MNDEYKLTKENILSALPAVLKNDTRMNALAEAVAEQLVKQDSMVDSIRIYTMLDSIPEELCDILAKDFDVQWYDFDYSVEEKRNLIKSSFDVHRHLGTVGAVEKAISGIYDETVVSEWFEYGGKPYHFKLIVNASYQNIDPQKHERLLQRMEFYKNKRSVLDEVEYSDIGGNATEYWFAGYNGESIVDEAVAHSY